MRLGKYILLFGLIHFCVFIFANSSLIKSSLFENYTVANGLVDEKIHCVFQDSKGWIWLGTDYGVFKFDGYTFIPFSVNAWVNEKLEKSLIRTITEDTSGNIWIGTDFNGLFKYSRKKNTLTQYVNKGFSHNSVWSIIQDRHNNLWLGTESGVTYFDTKTGQVEFTITAANSSLIKGNWIRKLYLDTDNNLWIGSNKGISVIDHKQQLINQYLVSPAFKERENEVWEIYKAKDGIIWVGTYLGGVFKIDQQSNTVEKIPLDDQNPRAVTVRSITQDFKGDLWLGTRGGLYSISRSDQSIKSYQNEVNNKFSLIHNSVLHLLLDKKGDLWVGTRNGLSFLNFDKQAFGYLIGMKNNPQRLNNGEVYVIWEDARERLWMGTESGGIDIYDRNKHEIQYITTNEGLSSNCIKTICKGKNQNILIGTYLGGLNILDQQSGKVKVFKHNPDNPNSLSDNEVWSIYRDSKQRVWVCTSKGLDLFDESNNTFKNVGPKYKIDMASMIFEDSKGNLWVNSADLKEMTLIRPNESVKKFKIQSRAMCEDIDGNLWLATQGNGLIMLDNQLQISEKYTMEEGLCSNILNGIINVNNEYLWLSSNNGIAKFNLEKKEFKNYYNSDGLLNNKFNYGAFCKTSNNSLAFGGKKGVDFVFLDKINRNDYIPPIVITGFRLFNKNITVKNANGILQNDISETSAIVLDYNQNMISFDFASLNYANSNKNIYKYKLVGFDKDWNDIGTARVATYTNLENGEYIFKVIGSNNDNVFNEIGVELAITILPPIWRTWWFKVLGVLYLLLLFYLIFGMIRNREKLKQELIYERQNGKKIQELDRLKHQFFMNMSHEIRTPLTLIAGPVDKLLEMEIENPVVKTNLDLIKRNANNLKRLVSQLLDYRKIETGNLKIDLKKGNLTVFVEELLETFRPIIKDKGLSLEFNPYQKSIFTWFDEDKVEKIINNLLSNAIKFTDTGGAISVTISQMFIEDIDQRGVFVPALDVEQSTFRKFIKIKVNDTGIGISEDNLMHIFDRFRQIKSEQHNQGSGIGLALSKELATIHQGHIKVRSDLGKGSRFSLYLPIYENMEEFSHEVPETERLEKTEENQHKKLYHILVVDDNPDLRKFINSHFAGSYKVSDAKNGQEGWEKALEEMPDLVIADVMMPDVDGNELCKRIKQDERTSHIPVIILSALGSTENQLAGIDAGADDYLTKPFDVGLLKAKVDRVLQMRNALRKRYSKEMVLKPTDVILASPDEKFLKRLIALVEKNMSKEDFDVDFIARNLDVSRTQLYRKIAALTNMTPKEFVKDLRLKRAAQLVVQGTMNISEIAYSVGFSDVSYFRKCFKQKFEMSATEYQQKFTN